MILEINFNFGNFEYSGQSTSFLLTIILPVLVAIFTVLFTLFCHRYYENYKVNESLDELYQHIKQQVSILNEAADKYANNLNTISEKLSEDEVQDIGFDQIAEFDVDLILDWKTTNFYNSVVSRRFRNKEEELKLIEQLGIIRSSLNKYKYNENIILESKKVFNMLYLKHQENWSDRITNYEHICNRLVQDFIGDKFLEKLTAINLDWYNSGKYEKNYVYENVVKPVILLSSENSEHKRATELIYELVKAQDAFLEIKNDKNVYSAFFHTSDATLKDIKAKIESAFEEVDKHQPKSKWQIYRESIS